jgi:HD superfamily phosphohydrolase YqeK
VSDPGADVALDVPAWARMSERRKAHVTRVVALLARWADELALDAGERHEWLDAGRLHDVLRDAPMPVLRAWASDTDRPVNILHGPAAAARLAAEGERRTGVLEAIRWHTIGHAHWTRTGQALYMADFLEPGRPFAQEERAALAARASRDFAQVLREVVKARIEWTLREGKPIFGETVALWNAVR